MDEVIGQMRWFGETWGAPINDLGHADTPVGSPCASGDGEIEEGDRGVLTAFVGDPDEPGTIRLPGETFLRVAYHVDCFMRGTLGPEGDLVPRRPDPELGR